MQKGVKTAKEQLMQFSTNLSVISITHHIGIVASDCWLSLMQSSCVLLQVLVARPYHTNEVQLTIHKHTQMLSPTQ